MGALVGIGSFMGQSAAGEGQGQGGGRSPFRRAQGGISCESCTDHCMAAIETMVGAQDAMILFSALM